MLKKISKIETPDAHTVIFRLDEVCSSLLNELSFTRPLTIHFPNPAKREMRSLWDGQMDTEKEYKKSICPV